MNMHRSIAVGIAASVLSVAPVDAAPKLAEDARVFVIGDQLAVELAGRAAFIDAVEAAGGSVHGLGRAGCEAATLGALPGIDSNDVVLVCVGMIDSLRGDSHLERFEYELGSAIGSVAHDQVALLTPVPREVEVGEGIAAANHAIVVGRYADAVGRVAAAHGCALVDLHDPLAHRRPRAPDVSLLRNGMHLDAGGWSLAEAEVLWQLEWSDVEPAGFESPQVATVDTGSVHELELLQGTRALPAIPSSGPGLPAIVAPVAPDWEDANAMLAGMDDTTDVEVVRDTMRLLTSAPDRREETLGILQGWTAEDRPDDVRLAAMAAIDDLDPASSGMQTVHIGVVPVKMTYDPARFEVVAGRPIRLILSNTDGQPHNLLVCAPGSLRAIGRASEAMGTTAEAKAKDWVPDSPKVLHVMPMIQLGGEGELRFMAPERPGRYPIICTYPGHWRMMNGVMTVRRPSE
jgi:uncharacterized cupredoxin-like copper-binding protein